VDDCPAGTLAPARSGGQPAAEGSDPADKGGGGAGAADPVLTPF